MPLETFVQVGERSRSHRKAKRCNGHTLSVSGPRPVYLCMDFGVVWHSCS